MKIEPDAYEFPLTLRVPKSAFVVVAPPPATVTQRTSELHFGISSRQYKEMFRDGLFPAKRIGRMIFASYEDVRRAVTEGAVARTVVAQAMEAAVAKPTEAPMSLEAARIYLETARSMRERRQRKKEIQAKAWELLARFEPNLADGSPNPNHDEVLHRHAVSLCLVCETVRYMAPPLGKTD